MHLIRTAPKIPRSNRCSNNGKWWSSTLKLSVVSAIVLATLQDTAFFAEGYDSSSSKWNTGRKLENETFLGASPCTYSPDYECYAEGWPKCCNINGGIATCRSPDDSNLECDIVADLGDEDLLVGSSVCTYAPNYECYASGWPACCGAGDNSTTVSGGCPQGESHECDKGLPEQTPAPVEEDSEELSSANVSWRSRRVTLAMFALVACWLL